jgi:AcrR family transcriptional regulator
MPRRILLTRPEKKAATRQSLVRAGRKLFLARGFHGATLDEIGLECGVTKGAVYANFADKNDLYLAVLDAHIEERLRAYRAGAAAAATLEELAHDYARVMLDGSKLAARWVALLVEVWTYAAGQPKLRAKLQQRHERMLNMVGVMLEEAAAKCGLEFRVSGAELARWAPAFARGLLLERLLDPQSVTDEAFEAAFAGFLRGKMRERSTSMNASGESDDQRGETNQRSHDVNRFRLL